MNHRQEETKLSDNTTRIQKIIPGLNEGCSSSGGTMMTDLGK